MLLRGRANLLAGCCLLHFTSRWWRCHDAATSTRSCWMCI
jgi:hypothetical protein